MTEAIRDGRQPNEHAPEPRTLVGRAAVVAAGTFTSRLLGLARDVSLAALFPLASTDAFWVAFTLPNALRQLLAEGAVASAVVPVLAEVRAQEGDAAAQMFFAKVRGLSLLVLVATAAAGIAAAPALVDLFAHGFAERVGQFERTVVLTRWVFPYIVFMGTGALGSAALTTHRRFLVVAFAPCLLNIAFLVAAYLLPGPLTARGWDPTLALAWGALLGGAGQVLVQLPSLRAIGYLRRPRFDLRDARVRGVLTRMGPTSLGLGIYAVDLVVCRRLLSSAGEGAQSYFSWAQRLCDFPQGVFAMALQTATLPSLAALAAKQDRLGLALTFSHAMRLALFVAVPVSVLFVTLAEPIVVMLFQRGHFQAVAAHETALALAAQGVGLWTVAAVRQLVPVFFALGDTRTPVIVSAIDLLALLLLAYGLTPFWGHVAISAAVAGSSLVQMALLWGLLARRLPTLHGPAIASSLVRILGASVLAGLTGRGVAMFLGSSRPLEGTVARLIPGIVGVAAFFVVFFLVAWGLRCQELSWFRRRNR